MLKSKTQFCQKEFFSSRLPRSFRTERSLWRSHGP